MVQDRAKSPRGLRFVSRLAGAVSDSAIPYGRLAGILPQASRGLTGAIVAGAILAALLPIAITVTIGKMVGAVPSAVEAGSGSSQAHSLFFWLGVVAVFFVISRALLILRRTTANALGRRVDAQLQQRVMTALGRPVGIARLEDPTVQDRIQQAQDIGGFGWTPGRSVLPLESYAVTWIQGTASAILLAGFNPFLALVYFLIAATVAHFYRAEYLRLTEVAADQERFVRRADYLREVVLRPRDSKEVRIWDLTPWLTTRFSEEWNRVLQPIWDARGKGNTVWFLATAALYGAQFGLIALIGLAMVDGEIGLASLVIFVGAVQGMNILIYRGNEDFALAYGTAAIPAVLELERLSDRDDSFPEGTAKTETTGPSDSIRLDSVSFRYPGQTSDVLHGLSLTIPAGRSLAIVGVNGAGKTTLIKLLTGLYQPSSGRIFVDGADLSSLDIRTWQRKVAAIFQDFTQYHLSARDNVTFGALENRDSEADINRAAELAGALDFVTTLPKGWDTVLSRQYTDGADLSGGQWQRLALARALFAVTAGATVLVLDEPTANLDVRAEAEIYERFLEITGGLTTIVISHRFSTVRRADHIVVIEDGAVVEQGDHTSLMHQGGRYAKMFNLQASRFVDEAEVVDG